ncbi:GNAT family N-acetyltransferase [Arthrobacter sp. JSM 101049]|uniref:GNAT family N-acetyltransferase n=1 Tax=Arthrobacter sp. JSM 101049 TaxID=929097 RepID=UPI003561EED2
MIQIDVLGHGVLGPAALAALRTFFDGEYLDGFGPWDADQPYGYAPHQEHVVARSGDDVVAHVGWARRDIDVGGTPTTIGGVGGVLIAERGRGLGLGSRLMGRAAQAMADSGGIDFGYLGCREEVVPFYASCGWHRVRARERLVGRDGIPVEEAPGQPLLVLPVGRVFAEWPAGTVDLRGRAW